jgi:hypothetical protein
MPSKSKKQHNLMAAVANNPSFAKKVGISVGEEFMKADKTKKFGSGGSQLKEFMKSWIIKITNGGRNKMGYMKNMAKKKMNMGGMAYKEGGKLDMAQDKKMAKKAVGMHESQLHGGKKSDLTKLKKGGMAKGCGYATGGKVSQLAKANGIAKQGKTKGKIC